MVDISYFRFACVFLICFLFDRLENPVKDDLWVNMANEANMAGVKVQQGSVSCLTGWCRIWKTIFVI